MPAKRPRISSARKSKKPLSAEKPALSSRRSFIKGAGAAVASAMLLQRAIADSWLDLVQMDDGGSGGSGSGSNSCSAGSPLMADCDYYGNLDTTGWTEQLCPNWCWATVTSNLATFFGMDWSACDVVYNTINKSENPNSPCSGSTLTDCQAPCDDCDDYDDYCSACDSSAIATGSCNGYGGVVDGLIWLLGGPNYNCGNSPYDFCEIANQICNLGLPIVCFIYNCFTCPSGGSESSVSPEGCNWSMDCSSANCECYYGHYLTIVGAYYDYSGSYDDVDPNGQYVDVYNTLLHDGLVCGCSFDDFPTSVGVEEDDGEFSGWSWDGGLILPYTGDP